VQQNNKFDIKITRLTRFYRKFLPRLSIASATGKQLKQLNISVHVAWWASG